MEPMPSQILDKLNEHNKAWFREVFREGGVIVDALGRDEGGWRYIFNNCVLAFQRKGAGKTCGENGGTRTNGAPCRRPARKNGDGRCAGHPYKEVVVYLNGDDKKIRPFPSDIPWEDVRLIADDEPIEAESPPCEALEGFYSATHVFNDSIADAMESMGISPGCLATFQGGTVHINPLWHAETLADRFPGAAKLNGRKLVPGFVLEDYGVSTDRMSEIL